MPEGPEAKIIATQLNQYISKKTLTQVKLIRRGYTARTEGITKLTKLLPLKVKNVCNKGKFIWINFYKGGIYVANRLGMTGSWSKTRSPYSYFQFTFSDKSVVYFNNPRKLGRLDFITHEQLNKKLRDLAPDILNCHITLANFLTRIKKYSSSMIYPLLLKQDKVISGVGNYIVNEALYRAKVHPMRKVQDLRAGELNAIYRALVAITRASYADKGCSQRDYVDVNRKKGKYQTKLRVYKRKVDPRGNRIATREIQGRRAWFVPSIQK